jgi:hypothetical protein
VKAVTSEVKHSNGADAPAELRHARLPTFLDAISKKTEGMVYCLKIIRMQDSIRMGLRGEAYSLG